MVYNQIITQAGRPVVVARNPEVSLLDRGARLSIVTLTGLCAVRRGQCVPACSPPRPDQLCVAGNSVTSRNRQ